MYSHVDYFENIATNLKAIKHRVNQDSSKSFFRISGIGEMEELLQNPNCKDLVMLVEDTYDGNYYDAGANVLDNIIAAVYIMNRVGDASDFDKIQSAKATCKETMRKVISRMYSDSKKWDTNTLPMRGFDINTMRYYSVGPIASGWYGIRMSFEVADPAKIQYNNDDWLDS